MLPQTKVTIATDAERRIARLAFAGLLGVSALFYGFGAPAAQGQTSAGTSPYEWRITKSTWTEADEARFSEFIVALGQAVEDRRCNTVQRCLHGRVAHPYRASNPERLTMRADCADLPYVLRAYFAWKHGLPFSYASQIRARSGARWRAGVKRDIRYSPNGNRVTGRTDVRSGADARAVFRDLRRVVSTGQFRTQYQAGDPELPDFYPVAIQPSSIRPGTVIYDPKGHVAIVYRVTPDGRVYFLDAHPDNSLTRGSYGLKFSQRGRGTTGPGFKNWRPMQRAPNGAVELAANGDIGDFSVEQHVGTADATTVKVGRSRRQFVLDGRPVTFPEFVRFRLAGRALRYDPVEELRNRMADVCVDLQYRQTAVEDAIRAGMHVKRQPNRLPDNIYGTHGEWEVYSTPSRDARLKTSFKEIHDEVARFLTLHAAGDERVAYSGKDLRAALFSAYQEEAQKCAITYVNSAGSPVTLGFDTIADRLFSLSFDPYHCVERRWGARDPAELSTCPDGRTKRAWFAAQQNLRNQIERRYDAPMGFDLAGLKAGGPGTGVPVPPAVSIPALLGEASALVAENRSEDPSRATALPQTDGPSTPKSPTPK